MKTKIIPVFVPHLGCPNDCVFCNQRKITGVRSFSIEDAIKEIDYFLNLYSNDNPIELAFYGGSFTAINKNLQFELLSLARDLKLKNKISQIRISTRPDCINEEILEYLKDFGLDTIELGVQSLDEEVLELSKRGHNTSSVLKSVDLIRKYSFNLGLQQMVGLPGDSEKKSIKTTYEIIKLNPDFVRIYPTLVIKDTELEDLYKAGIYKPFSFSKTVDIVTKILMIYRVYGTKVIRVGLQSTENLKFHKDVVAGPLNDAFREYCESEILFQVIKGYVEKESYNNGTFYGQNRTISFLVGQKGLGKKKLVDYYSFKNIKFVSDNSLENKLRLEFDSKIFEINIDDKIKKIVKGWENVFKKY